MNRVLLQARGVQERLGWLLPNRHLLKLPFPALKAVVGTWKGNMLLPTFHNLAGYNSSQCQTTLDGEKTNTEFPSEPTVFQSENWVWKLELETIADLAI